MGRSVSGSRYEEGETAGFIAEVLKKNRIDVQLQDVHPNRPNVLGLIDRKKKKTLLLESHMDTVDGNPSQFQPEVRDGKVYGRGACDTKASIAAFLDSVFRLTGSPDRLAYNVLLLFTVDEEHLFTGADHAVATGLKADVGIAGEPTTLNIIRAHKGVTRFKLRTGGKSAHSAYPADGSNAIYGMLPVLLRLQEYHRIISGERTHPQLGGASLSVGRISGGHAVNVVPDLCQIEIDRRTLPGETTDSVMNEIRALLEDLPEVIVEPPYLSVGGMDVPADADFVRHLGRSIKSVRGSVNVATAPYATNAGVYNRHSIPTVVFGPGNISQAHTDSEYVEIDQVQGAVAILTDVLTREGL